MLSKNARHITIKTSDKIYIDVSDVLDAVFARFIMRDMLDVAVRDFALLCCVIGNDYMPGLIEYGCYIC